jgi:hypothetical protein
MLGYGEPKSSKSLKKANKINQNLFRHIYYIYKIMYYV